MNDAAIARLLALDLSAGTDEFRESLLKRCLDVLGEEPQERETSPTGGGPRELSDELLANLSAAGGDVLLAQMCPPLSFRDGEMS